MSKAQDEAKRKHQKWLEKNGCSLAQIRERKKKQKKINDPIASIAKTYYQDMANTIAPPVLSKSIWDNLQNETPETIAAIKEKASMCMAPYSKGATQYIGKNKENIRIAGKKL